MKTKTHLKSGIGTWPTPERPRALKTGIGTWPTPELPSVLK
jgi:hypothetical protein